MSRPVFRIDPQLPPSAMKTYQIVAPRSTHFRKGTCEEANCGPFRHGWQTTVDESTELGQKQAYYIRKDAGRSFTEEKTDGGLTLFTFAAGQKCFRQHEVPLERDPLYVVRGGDWRGNPRGVQAQRHSRPDDWVDDFATHQQNLADRLERG